MIDKNFTILSDIVAEELDGIPNKIYDAMNDFLYSVLDQREIIRRDSFNDGYFRGRQDGYSEYIQAVEAAE